jgi:hypothetical protein
MQSQFEPYLKDVENRLRTLSKEEKAREITEIRSHLEAASEDYCDQGMSQERATMLSTEEFGAPKSVAKQLIKTIWRARLKNFPHKFLGTTLFCLPIPFINYYLSIIIGEHILNPNRDIINHYIKDGHILIYIYIISYIPFLIIPSYIVGRLLPKHAWRGVLIAHTVPFVLLALLYAKPSTLFKPRYDGEWQDPINAIATSVCVFVLFVLLWLIFPLKRYVRALLPLVPIALFHFCLKYCGNNFKPDDTTDPVKAFVWHLVNPGILIISLIVTGFIITCTSLGVGLGRLHANTIRRRQQRRMRAV